MKGQGACPGLVGIGKFNQTVDDSNLTGISCLQLLVLDEGDLP